MHLDLDVVAEARQRDRHGVRAQLLQPAGQPGRRQALLQFSQAALAVSRNGAEIDQLNPEIRVYKNSQQQNSIIGIRRRLNEDLYVNYSGVLPDKTKAIFQVYIFPLVSWIWIGYFVLLLGTIICLIPGKVRLQYARTEVIGFASTPAPVQP